MRSLSQRYLYIFMMVTLMMLPAQEIIAFQIDKCDMQSMTIKDIHNQTSNSLPSEKNKCKHCLQDNCCCINDQCNCMNITHVFATDSAQSFNYFAIVSTSPLAHIEHVINLATLPWLRPPISWNRQVAWYLKLPAKFFKETFAINFIGQLNSSFFDFCTTCLLF